MENTKDILKNLSGYKGVIYDFDGTIATIQVDWKELKSELQEYVLKETGDIYFFTPLDVELVRCRQTYGEEMYESLLKIIAFYEWKNGLKNRNNILIEYIQSSKQKQALFTMNTTQAIDWYIHEIFTINPFDVIITKNTCIAPKPSANDLQKIYQQWKLTKNDVVYIGNSDVDIESGRLAWIITYTI